MSAFAVGESDFLLDDAPFQILSGALHYFRVHPDHWADRIAKARLMGLNTIETYVPWNAHAPRPGEFITDGQLDLARFLELIAEAGMHAIVRPGPYICAEWDNGGFPAWLFRDAEVGVRRNEPRYLAAVQKYLDQVYAIVVPYQIDHSGPVILVQVENEYGAFGNDEPYLKTLVEFTRSAGITVPLVTVDQPTDEMLEAGGLDGVLRTASFGSRSLDRLRTLREHQPTGPLMCMEFWNGWFDYWGAHHHTTSVQQASDDLEALLAAGASVNLYMFHGGTNFGLTNGANDKGVYLPLVTSYDYDAPLDEAGQPTAKFYAFQEVLSHYADVPIVPLVPSPASPQRMVALHHPRRLFSDGDSWGAWSHHTNPPTLDELDHSARVAVFRTTLRGEGPGILSFGEVRDRAAVFLDGHPVGVLSRENHENSIVLPRSHGVLDLVVEDSGGVSYGRRIGEPKGLIGGVCLGNVELQEWDVLAIDLDAIPLLWAGEDISADPASDTIGVGPTGWRGTFDVDKAEDHFLDTSGWGRGIAWVNGFCLGRYWRRGPQETLYVPGPVLREGANDVVVLEMEVLSSPVAKFVDGPRLGHTEA